MSDVHDTRGYTITRVFDAPREAVWAAWTEPDQFAQWFGGPDSHLEDVVTEARDGGEWRADMVLANGHRTRGAGSTWRWTRRRGCGSRSPTSSRWATCAAGTSPTSSTSRRAMARRRSSTGWRPWSSSGEVRGSRGATAKVSRDPSHPGDAMRRLTLRKETLTDLTPAEMAAVQGGSLHLTLICAALVGAVVQTVKNGTHNLTLLECAQ